MVSPSRIVFWTVCEGYKLSFLERVQPSSIPHFLRDIKAYMLVTLVGNLWLFSVAIGLE